MKYTAHPTRESTQRNGNGLRHAHRTEDCLFPGPGQEPSWVIATLTTQYYLDILAKEAGVEAEPVGGDIEPTVEKEVSLEGTGTH